jgi:hypothetical protein
MSSLPEKIIAIYPILTYDDFMSGLIVLQNDEDGKGDYISVWKYPGLAEPTDEQLNAVP